MNEKALNSLEFNKIKKFISDVAVTYLGKEAIDSMHPSCNILEVQKMQNETGEAASLLLRKIDLPLNPISDISTVIKKAEINGILNPKELLEIADILRVSRRLKLYAQNDDIEIKYLGDYFESLYTNKSLEEEIERCIKSEDELDDRASKELYNIRRKIVNLESQIKDKLNDILKSNSKFLQDAVITFRNGRYVIPVKQEFKNEVDGLLHDYSATGNTVFIEPKTVFDKNNEIQELKNEEKIEIERILKLLTQMVSPLTMQIELSMKNIGAIDAIFAKARSALSMYSFTPSQILSYFVMLWL